MSKNEATMQTGRPIHLIYVTAALPFTTGETFLVPEIAELQKRGHRVTVVPTRMRRTVFHQDANRTITSVIAEPLISLKILRFAVGEIRRAAKLAFLAGRYVLRSRNPRILIKNLAVFPKGLWLSRVVLDTGADHIHAHWASTSSTMAFIASCVSLVPWSFTAHRWDITEDNILQEKAETAVFARSIDVRGGGELTPLMKPFEGKLRTIHMGVEVPSPRKLQAPQRPLQVLLAARISEVKGHFFAVEAVACLKKDGIDVALWCAGEGPIKRLERLSLRLGVADRVHFLGLIEHDTLLAQLRARTWDAALLPSIQTKYDVEGIPVFLMEAMANGIPVVSTTTGGIPELLAGGAGILIRERDPAAIADALTGLIAEPELYSRLAQAGVERIQNSFEIEYTVSALLYEIMRGIPREQVGVQSSGYGSMKCRSTQTRKNLKQHRCKKPPTTTALILAAYRP